MKNFWQYKNIFKFASTYRTMKAIGYGRVSTSKQVEFGTSLAEQERICRAMAAQDGIEDFIWLSDNGISGASVEARESYKQFLALISKGCCKVYAYSMSRLGRNLRTMMDLWDLADKKNVSIRTYSDNINTTGPMGKFIRTIMASVWELQREMIGEDTKDKLRSRKERGVVYSPPRYGFRIVGRQINAEGKVISPGTEELCDEEFAVVSMMQKLAESGVSYTGIANTLNLKGIPTKNGRKWHHGTIQKILQQHSKLPKVAGFIGGLVPGETGSKMLS